MIYSVEYANMAIMIKTIWYVVSSDFFAICAFSLATVFEDCDELQKATLVLEACNMMFVGFDLPLLPLGVA